MKYKSILIALVLFFLPLAGHSQEQIQPGSLIQAQGSTAVYYLAEDGKRYVFPNQKTYNTWYSDFSEVQVISLSQLQTYPIGGNVTYRPGTRLVKITTDPKTYAVEPGGALRWITSENIAKGLYGDNWASLIDDVPDPFFVNYQVDEARPIDLPQHPVGTLITYPDSQDIFMVARQGSNVFMRQVENLADNNFRQEFVRQIDSSITYQEGEPISSREDSLTDLTVASGIIPPQDEPEPEPEPELPPLAANASFVDVRVSVSGDGSLESPYQTLAEGLANLTPGMTLYLRGTSDETGLTYSETLNIAGSGIAGSEKTLAAFPNEKVVIALNSKLELDEDWWIIKDLKIDAQDKDFNAVEISGDDVKLDGVEVFSGLADGVVVMGQTDKATVINTFVHDFQNCILIRPDAANPSVASSEIYNCSGSAIEVYAESGTAFEDLARNVTIVNNNIYSSISNSQVGVSIKGSIGAIVALNRIHDLSSGKAIEITNQANSVTVSDNEIYNNQQGLTVRVAVNTPRLVDVFNNIFRQINDSAFYFDGVTGGLRVLHNTLVDISGSAFEVRRLGVASGQIRNNLISNAGANAVDPGSQKAVVSNNGWFAGAEPGDIAGADNTIGAAAGFIDASVYNYRLQASSPAVDAGIDNGVLATDFDDQPRVAGSAPDLGAFEVQ